MKWLGIEIALERLESPVQHETRDDNNNNEQPEVGGFISEPKVERALLDKSIRGFQVNEAKG
jgi:hypothetical protein